jgi:hypothetical protein
MGSAAIGWLDVSNLVSVASALEVLEKRCNPSVDRTSMIKSSPWLLDSLARTSEFAGTSESVFNQCCCHELSGKALLIADFLRVGPITDTRPS